MSKTAIGVVVVFLLLILFFTLNPIGVAIRNSWGYQVKKADDATNYNTRKQVEDTCRAMIASYTADKLSYEQYRQSDDPERQSWGDQAKMRANQTAANYNNYILKNSYVFAGNIPADIAQELAYIE